MTDFGVFAPSDEDSISHWCGTVNVFEGNDLGKLAKILQKRPQKWVLKKLLKKIKKFEKTS